MEKPYDRFKEVTDSDTAERERDKDSRRKQRRQKRWGLGKVKGGISTLPTATGRLTSQSGGLTTYLEQ